MLQTWVRRQDRGTADSNRFLGACCHCGDRSVAPDFRNIAQYDALLLLTVLKRMAKQAGSEDAMAIKENGQVVESTTEARQGEAGPSVLALLAISTGLAVLILGVVWFVFFRT
jgi:hypothetical protein